MVWSTAQSALYKAVDDYNSGVKCGENYRKNIAENNCEKYPKNTSEKCGNFERKNCGNFKENCAEKYPENSRENCGNFERKNCENYGEKCSEKNDCKNLQNDAKFTAKNCKTGIFANSISQPFADKDFILLAGLIFILMNEKADSKLILALVFVLLG